MGRDPGAEPVEVVDRDGRVVEVVTRREMRARRLRHRCTYVALIAVDAPPAGDARPGRPPPDLRPRLRPDDPVIVHRRADWKDTHPSYWDVAFGGVCGVGEPWEESARRELAEEAGVAGAPLVPLGPGSYEDAGNAVVGRIYLARWAGPLRFDDGEVVADDTVPVAGLAQWASTRPVCPDSAALVIPALEALIVDG